MTTDRVEQLATDLYGVDPDQFVSMRNSKAKEARALGDTATAQAIRGLKRPSISAWAINSLVRERAEEVGPFLELGERLRSAQASLDGEQLRSLSAQRRALVRSLGTQVQRIAEKGGHPLSDQAALEVEQTLEAALADRSCADEFAAGLLTSPLSHVGFSETTVAKRSPRTPSPTSGRAKDSGPKHEEMAEAQPAKRNAAGRAVEVADKQLSEARKKLKEQRARAQSLERQVARAQADVSRLEGALLEAQKKAVVLGRELTKTDKSLSAITEAEVKARRDAELSRRSLDALADDPN